MMFLLDMLHVTQRPARPAELVVTSCRSLQLLSIYPSRRESLRCVVGLRRDASKRLPSCILGMVRCSRSGEVLHWWAGACWYLAVIIWIHCSWLRIRLIGWRMEIDFVR